MWKGQLFTQTWLCSNVSTQGAKKIFFYSLNAHFLLLYQNFDMCCFTQSPTAVFYSHVEEYRLRSHVYFSFSGRDWTRQSDWTGLIFFVSAMLFSTFIHLFLLYSSVSLSHFNLTVPMRKCSGKHSCMSSPFSIAILNITCSLRPPLLLCGDVPAIKQLNYKLQINFIFFMLTRQTWSTRSGIRTHDRMSIIL